MPTISAESIVQQQPLKLTLTVLGRTLEHLGVQMYKRRDTAIAELIANCWDAGAKTARVFLPEPEAYDMETSTIVIEDDGEGMTAKDVQEHYLVVGRNRRKDGQQSGSRPVMGRKGIGKLAGFGIAEQVEVLTWRDDKAVSFTLDIAALKKEDGTAEDVPIAGVESPRPDWAKTVRGTKITLRKLKHKTALDIPKLMEALARRFSSRARGEMSIIVNGASVGDPSFDLVARIPKQGYETEEVEPGKSVRYYYGFSKDTIKSPELRGFTIYVRGKTAQAPPFFFNVEGTASGQHGTKYLTGVVEADYLDEVPDDEGDLISTDRQDIEWESERTQKLLEWGARVTRKALRECAEIKGGEIRDWILKDAAIEDRVAGLDKASRTQVSRFLTILGSAEPDRVKALELGDAIVRAFEYRHFHDVIAELEAASEDPDRLHELAHRLSEWKVLEGRAVLEIIRGRLSVIDKFYRMILNDAPETASGKSKTNLHDLIGSYPWLLNPEWQVFAEEKTISKQLQEWGAADAGDDASRFDFLALSDRETLIIVELKRANYAVTSDELLRLQSYREKLTRGWTGKIKLLLIYGGTLLISDIMRGQWERSPVEQLLTWAEVYHRARDYYEHYRAIVEGDVRSPAFHSKETEVVVTKKQLGTDQIYRSPVERKQGLGPQDTDLSQAKSVGILAFGSLILDPGSELGPLIEKRISVITPFEVEYGRYSSKRGGAPTLVRVESGGAKVKGQLLVLRADVTKEHAYYALWRRETHQQGTNAKPSVGNHRGVVISELPAFSGVDYVLYASNEVNIPSPDAASLAAAALKSLAEAPQGMDGVTYLRDMKALGIQTPLTDDYEAEILGSAKAASLDEVLESYNKAKSNITVLKR